MTKTRISAGLLLSAVLATPFAAQGNLDTLQNM
jgi:hypothetical protein